jgi:hypothetical protein
MAKKNPLKLNKLQLRTLALAQVLAREDGLVRRDEASGAVTLLDLPRAHGDHVHIGPFVVSARDISGFTNPAVWTVLARKGLARPGPAQATDGPTLTADGVDYETGLGDKFIAPSDH